MVSTLHVLIFLRLLMVATSQSEVHYFLLDGHRLLSFLLGLLFCSLKDPEIVFIKTFKTCVEQVLVLCGKLDFQGRRRARALGTCCRLRRCSQNRFFSQNSAGVSFLNFPCDPSFNALPRGSALDLKRAERQCYSAEGTHMPTLTISVFRRSAAVAILLIHAPL